MARPLRPVTAGGVYHLTTRGNNRRPIYTEDDDRRIFLHIFFRIARRYRWRVKVWCLMDNHYHLVVVTPQPNLPQGMRDLNGGYAAAFNQRHGREDHLFGRRYSATPIEDDEQYATAVDYVRQNPVRAGLVAHADDWPWTSPLRRAAVVPRPVHRAIHRPRRIPSTLRVPRHRQADPTALARRIPDGGAACVDRPRREVARRGVLRDVGRSVRAPLLLRPRRAPGAGRGTPVPARRVHGRGALHAPFRA